MSDACASCDVEGKLDSILTQVAAINRAFPDGPESHRAAHEAMIKASAAEERFWTELKLDVAKKGTWGIVVVLVGLVLVGVAAKFGLASVVVK